MSRWIFGSRTSGSSKWSQNEEGHMASTYYFIGDTVVKLSIIKFINICRCMLLFILLCMKNNRIFTH